jgi:hypothetical protein
MGQTTVPEAKPPPSPGNPVSRAINMAAEIVHELFHLAETNPAEAAHRLVELTGAGLREAQEYVKILARRR